MRLENELLIEHWDTLQDEVTQDESKSGLPMFGDRFPTAPLELTVERANRIIIELYNYRPAWAKCSESGSTRAVSPLLIPESGVADR